ncbi:MAG: cell division protein FtsL [Desulfobacterales bacterium]
MPGPTRRRAKPKRSGIGSLGIGSWMIRPWVLVLVLVMGEMLLVTWCRVQHMKVGYGITQATEEQQQLIKAQNKLKVEIARLRSPERIAKIARGKLGLTPPREEQMVVLP